MAVVAERTTTLGGIDLYLSSKIAQLSKQIDLVSCREEPRSLCSWRLLCICPKSRTFKITLLSLKSIRYFKNSTLLTEGLSWYQSMTGNRTIIRRKKGSAASAVVLRGIGGCTTMHFFVLSSHVWFGSAAVPWQSLNTQGIASSCSSWSPYNWSFQSRAMMLFTTIPKTLRSDLFSWADPPWIAITNWL